MDREFIEALNKEDDEVSFCSEWGKEITSGANFCKNCGNKIN